MKFTYGWLKDHLETSATVKEIAATLDRIGLEVESVTDPAETLGCFTVAEIIEAGPHPNAGKLQVCKVNTGSEMLQIVCGAPNARAGIKVVLGRPGDHVPGPGITLKETEIRGVGSQGMMCSERELGLSGEHEGIIELPADAEPGARFIDAIGLNDPVFEIAITPNRQDCLGVRGIARDLAAAGVGSLKAKPIPSIPGAFACPVEIRLETPACPVFAGRLIKGVTNRESPEWMRRRLQAIGLRPISVLVDVTNYIAYDLGRPLHVYDAAKTGIVISARMGKAGERFMGLDGKDHAVDETLCVIADENAVLGAGGIMGGEASGCTEMTRDVFIESAWFEPVVIALGGRKLGVDSDARYRFERGVDPESVLPGLEYATALILELCGGLPSAISMGGTAPSVGRTIRFRTGRTRTLGGLDLPAPEQARILGALGFGVEDGSDGMLSVTSPSWRRDVEGEADLVEEVIRIHGLDNIPNVPLPRKDAISAPALTQAQGMRRLARRTLAALGFNEAVTWSFMSSETAKLFGGEDDRLRLENPIASGLDRMRPSILPNLMDAARRNMDRGVKSVNLFEIGSVYRTDSPDGQMMTATGLRTGILRPRHWDDASFEKVSAYDAKRDVMAVLQSIEAPVGSLQIAPGAPSWYHPGRSAVLCLGPKQILAVFGELHPSVLTALDLKGPAVGFEIFLDAIPGKRSKGTSKGKLEASGLQPVERDFAFVVKRDVPASKLVQAVRSAEKALIKDISVFDLYEGTGLAADEKSLALAVTLQPRVKTFTDAEIEEISGRIVAAAAKAAAARLRGA